MFVYSSTRVYVRGVPKCIKKEKKFQNPADAMERYAMSIDKCGGINEIDLEKLSIIRAYYRNES